MTRILALIFSLFLTSAFAQTGTTVKQSGNITPGHVPIWATNGVIKDGGVAAAGFLTSLGVTATGPAICQNSGPTTGAYNQICLGVTPTNGLISFNNYGGATGTLGLTINGTPTPFGTVVGSVPTNVGGIPYWLNTIGTSLGNIFTSTPGLCLISTSSVPVWGSCLGGASVASVANSDGSLTISPTTGNVVASCTNATLSQFGCVKPDGSTIKVSGGVISTSSIGGVIDVTQSPYNCSTSNTAAQNATCLTMAFAAAYAAGGGQIWFPPANTPYVIGCFTIPNDGASVPSQPPFRLTSSVDTNGWQAQTKGAQLDLRCNTNARILSLGLGHFEINDITLINGNTGGGDTVPFILTTNTTLHAHDFTIIGDTSLNGTANIQDAIQLGGGGVQGNLATSAFGGYGTVIENVWADHIARFVNMVSSPSGFLVNAIHVRKNIVWNSAGSATHATIECNLAACDSNDLSANLFDQISNNQYPFYVSLPTGSTGNTLVDTIAADGHPATAYFHIAGGGNFVSCSSCTSTAIPIIDGIAHANDMLIVGNSTQPTQWADLWTFFAHTGFAAGAANGNSLEVVNFGGLTWSATGDPTNTSIAARMTQYAYGTGITFDNGTYGQFQDMEVAQAYFRRPVNAKATGYQVIGSGSLANQTDNNAVFTNTGAGGPVALTLPASPEIGATFTAYVDVAQTFGFTAGAGQTIRVNTAVSSAGGTATCGTIGCSLTIVYIKSNTWVAISVVGTWGTT